MTMWLEKPNRRLVIFDTKPRWRAEYLVTGISSKSRYKGWRHGDVFPNSVSITTLNEWNQLKNWRTNPVVIVQTLPGEEPDLDLQAQIAIDLYRSMVSSKDDLLIYLDETMDHFRPSATPVSRSGWIWQQICRNGRELGIGAIFASQRPKQIPISILEEMTFLFLFYIKDDEDIKRLYRMGFPRNYGAPERLKEFYYWRANEKRKVWGPYILNLGQD